jgi:hypothetical protein
MPILGIIASQNYSRFTATGSYDALATYTVPSGGVSSITFAGFPTNGQYQHLQIRMISRNTTASNQSLALRFNSDSGSNYSYHRLYGFGSGTGADGTANASSVLVGVETNTSSTFGASITDILDYQNTNIFKTTRSLTGWENNSDGRLFFLSGNWRSTSAITSITITPESNSFAEYSQFSVYGVK